LIFQFFSFPHRQGSPTWLTGDLKRKYPTDKVVPRG
jgi:hypothetical protein